MVSTNILTRLFITSSLTVMLIGGCSPTSHHEMDVMGRPSLEENAYPPYKVGTPYMVRGKKYYPQEDFAYDRTGIASWYGSDFHGRATANGEIYNRWDMTAAHKTLPMPTLVEVINRRNGRKIVVRINDRGPFIDGRIIDLSERAATMLGFLDEGTAPVRVRVLAADTMALLERVPQKGTSNTPVILTASRPIGSAGLDVAPPLTQRLLPLSARSTGALSNPVSVSPIDSFIPKAQASTLENSAPLVPVKVAPKARQLSARSESTIATATPPKSGTYLQIGAYQLASNARQAAKVATDKGHRVIVMPLHTANQTLYRVRIGPFKDVNDPKMVTMQETYRNDGFDTYVLNQNN